ncbi:MAG: hypothetical protein ABW006_06045 [Hyphomicrobium sp.]
MAQRSQAFIAITEMWIGGQLSRDDAPDIPLPTEPPVADREWCRHAEAADHDQNDAAKDENEVGERGAACKR